MHPMPCVHVWVGLHWLCSLDWIIMGVTLTLTLISRNSTGWNFNLSSTWRVASPMSTILWSVYYTRQAFVHCPISRCMQSWWVWNIKSAFNNCFCAVLSLISTYTFSTHDSLVYIYGKSEPVLEILLAVLLSVFPPSRRFLCSWALCAHRVNPALEAFSFNLL